MAPPPIIISAHPRPTSRTFDPQTRAALVWGSDEPMPKCAFSDALAEATAVAEWGSGREMPYYSFRFSPPIASLVAQP